MEQNYHLYYGLGKKEYFSLPAKWVPAYLVSAKEETLSSSIEQMTRDALSAPAGTPPFKELISGAKRIAIIVDDWTRPTPIAGILQVLLPYLVNQGFSRENVVIIVALGTHVAMTGEELEGRLGKDFMSRYEVVQHNAWQSDLVPIALPGDGRVVRINPEVARADVKIGISSILPHPMAGYGGGPKILMPGVSNFDFIRDHHMRHTIHPQAKAGRAEGNPFHEDCFRAARVIGLDFSINCVYNQHGQVVSILGGSLEAAFAAAVEACLNKLGARFEEKVDVTITSTYPHTHGHQFCKGLSAPDVVTKETGAILMVVPTVTPVSEEFVSSFNLVREQSGNNCVEYVKEAMSKGMPFLPEKPLEFNMAMSALILRPQIRTILVSPTISRDEAHTMGLEYATSVEEGLSQLERVYPKARVAIFPSGGLIIPIPAWKQ
ncbi:MAG: lactate racemase domain-containing protein [Syntrophales bacterium]